MKTLIFSFIFLLPIAFTHAWDGSSFKKPSAEDLRKKLTSEQYDVTQNEGTEAPFKNAYFDNHADGIYVDIVSGEPLFCSLDKFESGTGWPSFSRPIESANVITKKDSTFGMDRNEVHSKYAKSHLGHVFDDGPAPTGLRYCADSASLRFIPVQDLKKEGYAEYLPLFSKKHPELMAASSATPTPSPVKK